MEKGMVHVPHIGMRIIKSALGVLIIQHWQFYGAYRTRQKTQFKMRFKGQLGRA